MLIINKNQNHIKRIICFVLIFIVTFNSTFTKKEVKANPLVLTAPVIGKAIVTIVTGLLCTYGILKNHSNSIEDLSENIGKAELVKYTSDKLFESGNIAVDTSTMQTLADDYVNTLDEAALTEIANAIDETDGLYTYTKGVSETLDTALESIITDTITALETPISVTPTITKVFDGIEYTYLSSSDFISKGYSYSGSNSLPVTSWLKDGNTVYGFKYYLNITDTSKIIETYKFSGILNSISPISCTPEGVSNLYYNNFIFSSENPLYAGFFYTSYGEAVKAFDFDCVVESKSNVNGYVFFGGFPERTSMSSSHRHFVLYDDTNYQNTYSLAEVFPDLLTDFDYLFNPINYQAYYTTISEPLLNTYDALENEFDNNIKEIATDPTIILDQEKITIPTDLTDTITTDTIQAVTDVIDNNTAIKDTTDAGSEESTATNKSILDWLSSFWDKLLELLAGLLSPITDLLQAILEKLGIISTAIENIPNGSNQTPEPDENLLNKLIASLSGVLATFIEIPQMLNNAFEQLAALVGPMPQIIGDITSGMPEYIKISFLILIIIMVTIRLLKTYNG